MKQIYLATALLASPAAAAARLLAAAATTATIAAPAFANDSQANVAYGGLIFEQNPDITMDAGDLYLSLDKVRVRYTYSNLSAQPARDLDVLFVNFTPMEGGQ